MSIEVTPSAVLISVGHSEHSVTVIAEIRSDFWNIGSALTYTAQTIMVTIGSQASGDTGLKIWISGLSAALNRAYEAAHDAERHGDQRREQEAGEHRLQAGEDLVDVGRLAGVLATSLTSAPGSPASLSALRLS